MLAFTGGLNYFNNRYLIIINGYLMEKRPRGRPKKEAPPKNKRGRPRLPKYDAKYMADRVNEYVNSFSIDIDTYEEGKAIKIPFLEDCCNKNDWDYNKVSHKKNEEGYDGLKQAIKKLHKIKEIILVLGGINNRLNATMVIFLLKQPIHGYTDKQTQEVKTTANIKPVFELPKREVIKDDD